MPDYATIPVYVPIDAALAAVIDRGSAIVGSPTPGWMAGRADRIRRFDPANPLHNLESPPEAADHADESTLVVDYEGGRFGAQNIVTFADRCVHAHGRHVAHYPTVARSLVQLEAVFCVGVFYPEIERVEVGGGQEAFKLADWLGLVREDRMVIDSDGLHRELRGTGRRAP